MVNGVATAEKIIVKKAKSYSELEKKNFKTFPFTGQMKESFGIPERNGVWIIWGESGNGKTRLALQVAKAFTDFTKVHFNSLEEGMRLSFLHALRENNMKSVGSRITFASEDFESLKARLLKKRAPKVVFNDSLQYLKITMKQYAELKELFPDVVFVFVSHAKGDQPKGTVADEIRYDADVKIYVKDFVAQVKSRFGGNQPYVIWEEGVRRSELKLT